MGVELAKGAVDVGSFIVFYFSELFRKYKVYCDLQVVIDIFRYLIFLVYKDINFNY